MKKIVLSLFVVVSSVAAVNAQKGSWYLGGNVGLSSDQNKIKTNSTSTDNGKTTAWSLSPEIGTFLTNNIQLGIGFTFSGDKYDPQVSGTSTSNTTYYGATVYGRYFFTKSSTFKPFIGLNVKELPGTTKYTIANTSTKYNLNDFGVNLNAGFAYPLSKTVSAVGSFGLFGYENKVTKAPGGTKTITNSFGLDAGTLGDRFSVGIYFTLK